PPLHGRCYSLAVRFHPDERVFVELEIRQTRQELLCRAKKLWLKPENDVRRVRAESIQILVQCLAEPQIDFEIIMIAAWMLTRFIRVDAVGKIAVDKCDLWAVVGSPPPDKIACNDGVGFSRGPGYRGENRFPSPRPPPLSHSDSYIAGCPKLLGLPWVSIVPR